jgi:shikimate dehydrogenase
MMKAAVLGSPISHSLSPLLHEGAYKLLGIDGEYRAIEVKSQDLITFLDAQLSKDFASLYSSSPDAASRGFNLTMPLKERVFDFNRCSFDALSSKIRSANTLIREESSFRATSTDVTAFERLLQGVNVDRVAIIGGGGTARAALGAISNRVKKVDLLLRTQQRLAAMEHIAPNATVRSIPMDSPIDGYDLVINTTPAGVADYLSREIGECEGVLVEALYKPWPTELSFTWRELGGEVINGLDLLVEQALDAIALMTELNFDYGVLRPALLKVAYEAVSSQA